MKLTLRRGTGLLIRATVMLVVMGVVVWPIDLTEIGPLFSEVDPSYFVLPVLVVSAANLFAALAWKELLDALAVRLSYLVALRFYMIGLFFNIFAPGGVAGDAVRIHQLHRRNLRGIEGFTTIFVSRLLSIATLLLIGVVAAAIVLPGLPSSRLAFLLLAGAVVGLLLMLLNRPFQTIAVRLPWVSLRDLVTRVLESLSLLRQRPAALTKALGRDGAADGRTAPAGLRHPPLRTGRATFTASGSPSDGLDWCVGNIGFSAILVGFIHPASGVVRFVPLPSDCPPSPCGRLSRPRTTTRALPHVRRWPKAGLLRGRRAGRASQVRPGCIFMPS